MRKAVLIISLILLFGILNLNFVYAQTCSDSDNGVNYYANGQVVVSENGTSLSYNDACVYKLEETNAEFYVNLNGVLYNNKAECSGDNCYVAEGFCENNAKKWTVKTCLNGCSNGACLCPTTKCTDGNVYGPEKCKVTNNVCECPACPATPETCKNEGETISWQDSSSQCCGGLAKITESSAYSSDCSAITTNANSICTNCGNTVCGLGETKCNCPRDCAETTTTPVCQPTKCDDGKVYECKILNGICSCPACPAKPVDFYISGVEGVKKTYSPSETLNLVIKGVESDGTPASAEEGFNVQFYIDEWSLVSGQGSKGDNAYYKGGYWYGNIAIPNKLAGYRLQVFLYCSRDDSICAKKYGIKGAQVENTYYFSIIKSACSDTDGLDYYTKGFMKAGENDAGQYDACINQNEVVEYYCENNEARKATYSCPNGCQDGTCAKGEQVTEKITCKFQGTQKEQKCYLAGQFSDADLGTKYCIAAAGLGSCIITYTSYKGEQVTWKSSCGQYQYTTQDGNDKVIYFKCSEGETNITEIKNKGFRNAYFQCYDRAESKSTGREACKSADYWKKFAENFCQSHCDKKTGKCGVNTFSIGDECYLGEGLCNEGETTDNCCEKWAKENRMVKATCIGDWNIEDNKCRWSCKEERVNEPTVEPILVCKDSCALDGKCYPFGYRKSRNFCSDEGKFIEQKSGEKACDNNFECSSNVCVSGKCVSSSLIDKIISWFKKLFGGE